MVTATAYGAFLASQPPIGSSASSFSFQRENRKVKNDDTGSSFRYLPRPWHSSAAPPRAANQPQSRERYPLIVRNLTTWAPPRASLLTGYVNEKTHHSRGR